MKVLHLFSDQRFTGPAEPVLQACRALIERGHQVLLAHRDAGKAQRWHKTAARYGVPTTTRFALNRYWGVRDSIHDLSKLPGYLRDEKFDIVHSHLRHDQFLAIYAAWRCGRGRPAVLHTLHRRDVLPNRFGTRFLMRRTDGLLAFTDAFRDETIRRFGLDPRRLGLQPMGVDLEALDPAGEYRPMRPVFGIPDDALVIGIVGRFQQYRKMDVFLAAVKRFVESNPSANVRFLVIGRSRSRAQTVDRPVKELGLERHVVIGGYRREDYNDTLACMDVFTLLMPGSDGTARAVRQAMAVGKPCVVSDYGMLPQIVRDSVSGLVVPMEADALAGAWGRLVGDHALRKALGEGARREAVDRFNPGAVGQSLESFYERILALPRV